MPHTTTTMVLTPDIFLGISEVPIGKIFRETVENILSVNIDVQRLVADAVMTVHAGYMAVAEDSISQKLKPIV